MVQVRHSRHAQHAKKAIHRYFSVLLDNNHGNYDYVFIIKMECMPADILQALRQKNAKAKFIYYSYDSVKNNGNFLQSVSQFDSAFTFDDQDAQAITGIRLRPLFFLNEYRDLPRNETAYAVSFIGTAHSDRYALVKKSARPCLRVTSPISFSSSSPAWRSIA